jgi:hypothetical protein
MVTSSTKTAKGVMRRHHTRTSSEAWDGDAAERRLGDDDVRAFRAVFAYVDPDRPENKTAAKFPHHEVGRGGRAGPANVRACISGIGILNGGRGGADVDGRERRAIYAHLATHLKDAGREPPELA